LFIIDTIGISINARSSGGRSLTVGLSTTGGTSSSVLDVSTVASSTRIVGTKASGSGVGDGTTSDGSTGNADATVQIVTTVANETRQEVSNASSVLISVEAIGLRSASSRDALSANEIVTSGARETSVEVTNTSRGFSVVQASNLGKTRVANSSGGIVSSVTGGTEIFFTSSSNTSSGGVRSGASSLSSTGLTDSGDFVASAVASDTIEVLVSTLFGLIFNGAVGVRYTGSTSRRLSGSSQPFTISATDSITSASRFTAFNGNKIVRDRVVKSQLDSFTGSYDETGRETVRKKDPQRSIERIRIFLHVYVWGQAQNDDRKSKEAALRQPSLKSQKYTTSHREQEVKGVTSSARRRDISDHKVISITRSVASRAV
jgi:hypothetical protein